MPDIKYRIHLGNCMVGVNESVYTPVIPPPITWDMTTVNFDNTQITFDSM